MSTPNRPAGVVVSVWLTALAALALVAIAIFTFTANPTGLSGGVAGVLILWAAIVGAGAWGAFQGRRWARGIVVAAGLLHLVSCLNFIGSQPWAIVPALLSAVTVVGVVLPASTEFFGFERG